MVAIDIDGTLGDYHEHFLKFAEGYVGHALPQMWEGDPPDWEDYLGLDRNLYREIKLAFRQGGMKRTMPVYDGASTLAMAVRAAGAELWVTTTRPYNRLDSVDPDTREWLSRNSIAYDHLLYDDDKYGRLATLVDPKRVVAVLEDLPGQCRRAVEEFGWATVYMRYNTHNRREQSAFQGFGTLGVVTNTILRKITAWEEQYG